MAAHSYVLCQESSYFKVICKSGFLVRARSCCVETDELADTSPETVPAEEKFLIRRLLHYCYLTGYKDDPYKDENDPPPHIEAPAYINRLHLNARMYSVADRYDILSLKEEAAGKFDAAMLEMKDIQRMKTHNGASLSDKMTEAFRCIYSSTLDGDHRLRDRAVEIMHYIFREHPGREGLIAEVP